MALATDSTSNSVRRISAVTSPSSKSMQRPAMPSDRRRRRSRPSRVDDELPAEVADLGRGACVRRRSPARPSAATRSIVDGRVEALVEAGGLRARRAVADEDQRVVVGPPASLGGQPAEPVDADHRLAASWAHSAASRWCRARRRASTERRPRNRSRRPRCRCCRRRRARRRRPRLAQDVDRPRPARGPLSTRSPATRTESGFSRLRHRPATASSAASVAVDVGQDGDRGVIGARPRGGMMKLSSGLAGDLAVDAATARPRPKRRPSFSIVTSSRSVSPGLDDPLEAQSSMPANSPIRSPKPGCLAT